MVNRFCNGCWIPVIEKGNLPIPFLYGLDQHLILQFAGNGDAAGGGCAFAGCFCIRFGSSHGAGGSLGRELTGGVGGGALAGVLTLAGYQYEHPEQCQNGDSFHKNES